MEWLASVVPKGGSLSLTYTMGSVLSSLTSALSALRALYAVLKDLHAQYADVLSRARAVPSLPVTAPTAPYWLEDPPYPELADAQSPVLPPEADVVVIGSGLAGAAIARSLLHECARKGDPKRVVVLEARQICSGATGRNGGHIKASPHEVFAHLRGRLPAERAAALCRFQARHLEVLTELCRDEGFDVAEAREVETVDLFIGGEALKEGVKRVEEFRRWVPEFAMHVWDGPEARQVGETRHRFFCFAISIFIFDDATDKPQKFSVNNHVAGAVSYRAGALWPYRFVTSVWKKLTTDFPESLSIETSTPVESIEVGPSPGFPYQVVTGRGTVRARHVVHATNAYASRLVPGLRGKMTGILCHMTAQRPGRDFPDLNGARSWSPIYGTGFDYITQRPTVGGVPGDLMLGGGFFRSAKQGLDYIGDYDDGKLDALTLAHLEGILPTLFAPRWGQDGEGGRVKQVWSGVVGMTADFRPFVGRLDPRLTGRNVAGGDAEDGPAEWIAAGFVGDGMVWAWLCGTALGIMVAGSEGEDLAPAPGRPAGRLADWFPPELLATYARIEPLDVMDLAEELM